MKDNYNILLTLQFESFPPRPPSTLCMGWCQVLTKRFRLCCLFEIWMESIPPYISNVFITDFPAHWIKFQMMVFSTNKKEEKRRCNLNSCLQVITRHLKSFFFFFKKGRSRDIDFGTKLFTFILFYVFCDGINEMECGRGCEFLLWKNQWP